MAGCYRRASLVEEVPSEHADLQQHKLDMKVIRQTEAERKTHRCREMWKLDWLIWARCLIGGCWEGHNLVQEQVSELQAVHHEGTWPSSARRLDKHLRALALCNAGKDAHRL